MKDRGRTDHVDAMVFEREQGRHKAEGCDF